VAESFLSKLKSEKIKKRIYKQGRRPGLRRVSTKLRECQFEPPLTARVLWFKKIISGKGFINKVTLKSHLSNKCI
jgi:hypothetical protein